MITLVSSHFLSQGSKPLAAPQSTPMSPEVLLLGVIVAAAWDEPAPQVYVLQKLSCSFYCKLLVPSTQILRLTSRG